MYYRLHAFYPCCGENSAGAAVAFLFRITENLIEWFYEGGRISGREEIHV